MERYHSKYEAYPFLCDPSEDLRCDFEIFTDILCGQTGLLRAKVSDPAIRQELLKVGELIYHANPTLRTKMTVTQEEVDWLLDCTKRHQQETAGRCQKFVLPQGSEAASMAHILRAKSKALVRMLYRWDEAGHAVNTLLIDFANLLSGYFFSLCLRLNQLDGVDEVPYTSRNYH